jgi:hypothetical protein
VIHAVQDAVVELLRPKVAAARLALAGDPALTGAGNASPVLVAGEGSADVVRRSAEPRRWPFYVGLGTAAASVLSLSAAAILSVMANEDPSGANRAEMQRDLARRDDYATAANASWIVGGTLGVTAIGMFVWQRSQSDGR